MLLFKDVIKHYETEAAIAKVLGITRQAVFQWDKNGPIPVKQELRLRHEICRKVFKKLKSEGCEIKERP